MTALLFLALFACGQTEGDPSAPVPPGGGAPPTPGAADPMAGGGAVAAPVAEPKYTQEQLGQSPDVVKISGTIACSVGNGPFIVQLYPPPPDQGGPKPTEGDAPPGPLTQANIASVGEMTMLAPKGDSAVAVAFLDSDGNGMATPGEPLFFGGGAGPTALKLDADLTGVAFDCSLVAMPGGGAPPAGEAPSAPPTGEAPPAGGAPPTGEAPPAGATP